MKKLLILLPFFLFLIPLVQAKVSYNPRTWVESCSVERDYESGAYIVDGNPYDECPDKNFLSKYIDVTFPSYKRICLEMKPILWNRLKECYLIPASTQKLRCLKQIYQDYKYKVDIDLTETQWVNYLQKLRQYPIKKLTSRVSIDKNSIDFINKKVCLNIDFPQGFKEKEKIKLGFMSTTYTTSTQILRVTGTETCGDGFNVLYQADKQGIRNLTGEINGTTVIYNGGINPFSPADNKTIPINITVQKLTESGFCYVTGTLINDTTITENVSISADGSYRTFNYWQNLTGVVCNITFNYTVVQEQFGIIWKSGTRTDEKQYFFDNVTLHIGDDSTYTCFKDTNCQVTFSIEKPRWAKNIMLEKYVWFQLGVIEDETSKTGEDGCLLTANNPYGNVYLVGRSGDGTTAVRFYASSFTGGQSVDFGPSGSNGTAWFCNFETGQVLYGVTVDFNRVNLIRTNIWNLLGTFNDVYIYGLTSAYTRRYANQIEITNLKARNITYILQLEHFKGNAILNFTDADTDSWETHWANDTTWHNEGGTVLRKYTFDMTITTINETAIDGAVVDIIPSNTLCESFSLTTDTNGNTPTKKIWHSNYTQFNASGLRLKNSTIVSCNPYIFTISKSGYETLNFTKSITEKTKETRELNASITVTTTSTTTAPATTTVTEYEEESGFSMLFGVIIVALVVVFFLWGEIKKRR